MAKKTSSAAVARIAARILAGGDYSTVDVRRIAASVVSQSERELRSAKSKAKP